MKSLILMIFILTLSTIVFSQSDRLIPLTMQDQYDSTVTDASLKAEVIVLLGADRKGSKFTDAWGKTIADSLRAIGAYERAQFVALANVSSAPSALRGMVKGSFRKPKMGSVLLDWQGAFAEAYQFVDDSCMILLFDQERKLVYRKAVTKHDPTVAGELGQLLRGVFSKE